MFANIIQEKQPKALYLILALEALESFSHYGIRFLLVLYLVNQLNFSYVEAFSIFAVYVGLSEVLGIVGGRIADKFLGLYQSLYVCGIIMLVGYAVMAWMTVESMYIGLAASAAGCSMYKASIAALLGESYRKNDLRRDAGFTYLHVSLNFGLCLSTAIGGYVALQYGWQYLFALFAITILLGMILLYIFQALLRVECYSYSLSKIVAIILGISLYILCLYCLIKYHAITVYIVTVFAFLMLIFVYYISLKQDEEHNRMMRILLVSIFLLGVFYAFQSQINLVFIEFGEKFVEMTFLWFHDVKITSLLMFNPIGVILFGPFIAVLIEAYEMKRHHEANLFMKIAVGFFIIGFAYAVLYFDSKGEAYTHSEVMVLVLILIGVAELFVDPAIYSYASEAAPAKMHATLMGTIMLGFSISGLGGGVIASFIAHSVEKSPSIDQYAFGFINVAVVCVTITISLVLARLLRVFIISKRRRSISS